MNVTSESLFATSSVALERRHPYVWEKVIAAGRPMGRAVMADGGMVNIDVGGKLFYPQSGPELAAAQVAAFRQNAPRLSFANLGHCNITPISERISSGLKDWVDAHGGLGTLTRIPDHEVGFLFVYGLGLGHHLPLLLADTPALHIVIVETVPELLRHAAAAIDWQALFAAADARGKQIHLIVESDPEEAARAMEVIVASAGNTFLDGSYHYFHYASHAIKQVFDTFSRELHHHYKSSGYFEDEMVMVGNTAANLRRVPFRLIEGGRRPALPVPAFVIASGPSLDKDLPYIRKWRDRAVVISCGTALRPLLKNGVRPDIHCEVERVEAVATSTAQCRDEFGLDGIVLMASTTVDPRAVAIFDERWLFFRHGLTPSFLMTASTPPLSLADPLGVNAATAGAIALGLRCVYLFGVDLSIDDPAAHHAKDSIYYQPGNEHLDAGFRAGDSHAVPGNFGGEVHTLWAYDMGRHNLGHVQRDTGAALFNCGRGARISGAVPKAASAIDLSQAAPGGAAAVRALAQSLRAVEPNAWPGLAGMADHATGCREFGNGLPLSSPRNGSARMGFRVWSGA